MAKKVVPELIKIIDSGNDIIVSEPSVLAMFRFEYEKLLDDQKLFNKIKSHCFDPFEYINLNNDKINIENYVINKNSLAAAQEIIQPESVSQGAKMLVSVYAAIPFFMVIVLLFFYEINKKKEVQIEKELSERRKANI